MIGERRYWGCEKPVTRLRSHTIDIDEYDLAAQVGSTSVAVRELGWKLNAEQERLMRLLPDPPVGYHWEFEHLRSENLADYAIHFQVVAQLKED